MPKSSGLHRRHDDNNHHHIRQYAKANTVDRHRAWNPRIRSSGVRAPNYNPRDGVWRRPPLIRRCIYRHFRAEACRQLLKVLLGSGVATTYAVVRWKALDWDDDDHHQL